MSLYPRLWQPAPLFLLGGSTLLLALFLFQRLTPPSVLAAFSIYPSWLWALPGVTLCFLARFYFRLRGGLRLTVLWLLAALLFSDPALSRCFHAPALAPPSSLAVRASTWNSHFHPHPEEVFSAHLPLCQSDVIFLQEFQRWQDLHRLRQSLPFPEECQTLFYPGRGCALIVRGEILAHQKLERTRGLIAHVRLLSGPELFLLNTHLQPAETDLRFWKASTHRSHWYGFLRRRAELARQLAEFHHFIRTHHPEPAKAHYLIGGDFNAPPNSPVYSLLSPCRDAFLTAGAGWGGTFHSSLPIFRIDSLFASSEIKIHSAQTFSDGSSSASDHRPLTALFSLPPS